MPEGYHCRKEGDCSYSRLDELLCEYVDGTMDPAVCKSFEAYLATDPLLAQQVERLRRTRSLLCRHGCRIHAPRGLQARIRRRLAAEIMRTQPPFSAEAVARLGHYAMFTSMMILMLMAGMLVGAELYTDAADPAVRDRTAAPDVTRQEVAVTPQAGHRPMRLPWFVGRSAPVLLPPSSAVYLWPGTLEAGNPAALPAGLQRTGATP